ncbi:uncharacterized protein [Diadema antillarum]|uniref:uncharacterized protein n=1 Tax=Diadema antillarum TaxID=105358 RepID=UPI003A8A47D6
MPQIRYFHQGRYYRPARPMPLLPPLSLVPAVDPSKHAQLRLGCHDDETVARKWKTKRDKEFRWMVRYIGENLTIDNVADIRFLCRDHVHPPDLLRQSLKGPRLMGILEGQRLVAENSLFFLQTLLFYIARPDLYELVLEFRNKRQDDHRKMGVEILYETKPPNERGLALSQDLRAFRKKLKPRSRFNTVDIQAMMKRLAELKSRMQSQLPKPLDPAYATAYLSAATSSNTGDSDWEDVDSDDDDESRFGESLTNRLGVKSLKSIPESRRRAREKSAIKRRAGSTRAAGRRGDGGRLPDIRKKALHVKVKTGRPDESDYETDGNDDDGEVNLEASLNKSRASISSGGSAVSGVSGPSKPTKTHTHRSTEFGDLHVKGQQTYSDDDVIACVRDFNKIKSEQSSQKSAKSNEDDVAVDTASEDAPKEKEIPRKIKLLRQRFRKTSPEKGIRRNVPRKKKMKSSTTLPKLQHVKDPSSLERLKTTRNVPLHDPQQLNFLPDIYDKYARRSVSTTTSSKTSTSRKSLKR